MKRQIRISMFFLLICLVYLIIKAVHKGSDIDIYLRASRNLLQKESLYGEFLYSPLFAMLLSPLSLLDLAFGRVIWTLINFVLVMRLWVLVSGLISKVLEGKHRTSVFWTIGVVILSFGFLNHNFILGQLTILILWLTLEGLHQILIKGRNISGAALLALGINFKIIPIIALFYLFFKGKFKAMGLSVIFIIIGLFLPSLFVGHDYNMQLLHDWKETISPSNERYIFEQSSGTHSLNAILPAYFYDFNNDTEESIAQKRLLISIPDKILFVILQSLRIMILFSLLLLVFHQHKDRDNKALFFFWEFSYLALVTILIFPHQQKYAMLFFVPAGSYMLLYILLAIRSGWNMKLLHKFIVILSGFFMLLSAIMGRDIVGDIVVDTFDYYHYFGLVNVLFLFIIYFIKPKMLMDLAKI